MRSMIRAKQSHLWVFCECSPTLDPSLKQQNYLVDRAGGYGTRVLRAGSIAVGEVSARRLGKSPKDAPLDDNFVPSMPIYDTSSVTCHHGWRRVLADDGVLVVDNTQLPLRRFGHHFSVRIRCWPKQVPVLVSHEPCWPSHRFVTNAKRAMGLMDHSWVCRRAHRLRELVRAPRPARREHNPIVCGCIVPKLRAR